MPNPARLTSLIALAICLGAPSPSRADWRRIDSPNFVVIGDLPARDLRDVAVKFEAFRETLSRVLTERAISTAVPTVVIVFPHDRAFTPFKPRFQGKTVDVGGLFLPRQDINYIAIVSDGQPRLPIVFHEYAHLVIANVGRSVPVWLSEGLAEYYSTFELSHDRREALLGLVPENRLAHLNETTMLPLETLLSVDHDSPLYNEGNRRSTFYAQAWALTHLILLGKPNRTPQLVAYLDRLSQGIAPGQAWQQAFGPRDLARELESYVRQQAFRATRYRFAEKLATFDASAALMPPAEVQAFLAEFLLHQQRIDEALERLAAAAKLESGNVRVGIARAFLDVARKDYAGAENQLRALGPPKDWLSVYLAGMAVADLTERQSGPPPPERLDAARAYFGVARAVRPEFPNALARRAELELRDPGVPSADTRAAVERARAQAPGRHDYTLLHAQILARQSEFATARAVLGPLLSNLYPLDVRESARSLMARIVEVESSRLVRSGGLSGGTSTTAPVATSKPDLLSTPAMRPLFREVKPGEQRLEGMLERIECTTNAAIFHVRTPAGPATFTAARLNDVDFITYRSDLTGSVACGALREAMPVFVIWRAAASPGDRIVVAIEFPPKSPNRELDASRFSASFWLCRDAIPAAPAARPRIPA